MTHGVPQELHDYQQRCHNNGTKVPDIFCPLGHCHVPSGVGEAERERKRREKVERELETRERDLLVERNAHKITKTKLTKQTRRVTNGVCPECSRSFVQLARHMKSQHPGCIA